MTTNKILLTTSERLGIRDTLTIQKAETFLRLLNTKPASKTINDVGKLVLCLDLAATYTGIGFDKDTGIKLTGMRRNVYQNNLNNLEKILNLEKPILVSELCVQFSCTEAKEMAETILGRYKECDTKIKDIGHPQYTAAAVYTSCKLNGIKVNKSQFREISRLKVAQWKELVDEFDKFAVSLGLSGSKKCGRKREPDENQDEVMEIEGLLMKPGMQEKEEVIEEYEVWRERILREAAIEIMHDELIEENDKPTN